MKNTLYCLLFIFLISCDSLNSYKEENSVNQNNIDSTFIEKGNNSLQKELSSNENDLNLSEINNYIIQKPESSNGYFRRAIYYKKINNYQLALDDINRAISVSSDVAVFNYTKAEILYEFGVFSQDISLIDESKIYLDHCISLDKEFFQAKLLQSKLLLFDKKTDQAMVLVNDVLKLNSKIAEAYLIKGMIYEILGNSNLAISSFQTAIEVEPNFYDAYIHLGVHYEKINNKLAIDYYNSAIDINPSSIEAFLNKGLFYHFNMNYEMARNSFNEVLKIDSTFEVAYFNIGNTFLGQYATDTLNNINYIPDALIYFNMALDINPYYVQAIHNIGVCNEIKGDKLTAKKYYLEAVNLDNNYAPSLDALNDL